MLTREDLLAGAKSLLSDSGTSCSHRGVVEPPTEGSGWFIGCRACGWEAYHKDSDVVIRALVLKALGHSAAPAVGDWYCHNVGDKLAVVKIQRIEAGRIFFHDHTTARLVDVQYGGDSFKRVDPPEGSE